LLNDEMICEIQFKRSLDAPKEFLFLNFNGKGVYAAKKCSKYVLVRVCQSNYEQIFSKFSKMIKGNPAARNSLKKV